MLPLKSYCKDVPAGGDVEKVAYPVRLGLSVKKTCTLFSEMYLAVLLSLMSLNSSKHVSLLTAGGGLGLTVGQGRCGILLTKIAWVQVPGFVSNSETSPP